MLVAPGTFYGVDGGRHVRVALTTTDERIDAAAGRLTVRARRVAADVMRSLSDRTDWSDWRVSVHDLSGRRVLVEPFRQPVAERPLAA